MREPEDWKRFPLTKLASEPAANESDQILRLACSRPALEIALILGGIHCATTCVPVDRVGLGEGEIPFWAVTLHISPQKSRREHRMRPDDLPSEHLPKDQTSSRAGVPSKSVGGEARRGENPKKSSVLNHRAETTALKLASQEEWSGPGSNRRHRPFQGRALPTELPDQLVHSMLRDPRV